MGYMNLGSIIYVSRKCYFSPLKIRKNKIRTSLCISSESFNMSEAQFDITIKF